MRNVFVILAFLALTSPVVSIAGVTDRAVAEELCRREGFAPERDSFNVCVTLNLAELKVAQKSQEVQYPKSSEGFEENPSADPYTFLDNDFARSNFAYNSADYEVAYDFMIKAARAGDQRAFAPVARFYMNGIGVVADHKKSMFWLKKAESVSDPQAYVLRAEAYLYGKGVPQDFQKAYRFVGIARNFGADLQAKQIEDLLKHRLGDDAITCAGYGMALDTPENGQCRLQLQQARQLAQQQAQLARQQELFAQQQADFARQQRQIQAQQYERQLAAERMAREEQKAAERRAASERLIQLGEDLLCPKQGPGLFAPPVAGCGSNRNAPQPSTTTVIVNVPTMECKYRTAAGCR